MTQARHTAQLRAIAAMLAAPSYVDPPTIPAGVTVADYRASRPATKRTHRHPNRNPRSN